jgi:hypothetical protein
MSDQRFCEHCGAALAAGVRFCEQCGQPLAAQAPPNPVAAASETRAKRAAPDKAAWRLRPAAILATLLLMATIGAWWLLAPPADRPADPTALPRAVEPMPERAPMPVASESTSAEAGEPPVQAEFDPALAAARQRRDSAFSNYTRIAVGEIAGDIEAAREEYRRALEDLEVAERAAGRPAD